MRPARHDDLDRQRQQALEVEKRARPLVVASGSGSDRHRSRGITAARRGGPPRGVQTQDRPGSSHSAPQFPRGGARRTPDARRRSGGRDRARPRWPVGVTWRSASPRRANGRNISRANSPWSRRRSWRGREWEREGRKQNPAGPEAADFFFFFPFGRSPARSSVGLRASGPRRWTAPRRRPRCRRQWGVVGKTGENTNVLQRRLGSSACRHQRAARSICRNARPR